MSLTVAEINLSNLKYNFDRVRSLIRPSCRILAVVKANAYGHGLIRVSRELEDAGTDMFGVAHVEEGIRLREAGIQRDILILAGTSSENIRHIVKWRLTPVVYSDSFAEALSQEAIKTGIVMPVHIKVDTGMRRIGVCPEKAAEFAMHLASLKGIKIEGIMTHFAEADLLNRDFALEQLESFQAVCRDIREKGIDIPIKHTANSAAIIEMADAHFNMVRPGIMLYGYLPSQFLYSKVDLRSVMNIRSRIIHLKSVPAKTGISYGRTFVTERETLVATIPVGYADGYSRALSNKGEVSIRGCRAPIIGRVCMDMMMVDVTDIGGVQSGEEVILIGGEGAASITADDIAEWAGTISYEVLCGIGERVERVYIR